MRLQPKKRVADGISIQDVYSADIVENLDDADDTLTQRFGRYMAGVSLPVTVAAEMARARIKKLFGKEGPDLKPILSFGQDGSTTRNRCLT